MRLFFTIGLVIALMQSGLVNAAQQETPTRTFSAHPRFFSPDEFCEFKIIENNGHTFGMVPRVCVASLLETKGIYTVPNYAWPQDDETAPVACAEVECHLVKKIVDVDEVNGLRRTPSSIAVFSVEDSFESEEPDRLVGHWSRDKISATVVTKHWYGYRATRKAVDSYSATKLPSLEPKDKRHAARNWGQYLYWETRDSSPPCPHGTFITDMCGATIAVCSDGINFDSRPITLEQVQGRIEQGIYRDDKSLNIRSKPACKMAIARCFCDKDRQHIFEASELLFKKE